MIRIEIFDEKTGFPFDDNDSRKLNRVMSQIVDRRVRRDVARIGRMSRTEKLKWKRILATDRLTHLFNDVLNEAQRVIGESK